MRASTLYPASLPVAQVGGAHWLSENMPTVVDVEAAKQGAGRTEGAIPCRVTYTGGPLAGGRAPRLVEGAIGRGGRRLTACCRGLTGLRSSPRLLHAACAAA
jgi:hypothetical protein